MRLTEEEKGMLNGDKGKGTQYAMEILLKMGELYGAERFLQVKNAHIDAAAHTTIWDAGTEFIEFLVDNGARAAVPTTINPVSRDRRRWRELYTSPEFSKKSERLEQAYLKLGVNPTWTCAPYQCTNVPVFGENVSWSESNAVNYVNSVIGARTERLPDLVKRKTSPAAILCIEAEPVLALGPLIGEKMYGRGMALRTISKEDYAALKTGDVITFSKDSICIE